jgi:heat shock protein HtpX
LRKPYLILARQTGAGGRCIAMKNRLKTLLLLGALSGVLIALGGALGGGFLHASLVMAALLNLGAWFFSDRIVLATSRARELAPEEAPGVHRMVAELAQAAGIPKPRVYWMPDPQPNAFATGRSPEKSVVAVTAGILRMLDERELRAVLAHEISHVRNRDVLVSSIAATLAAAVTWLAHLAGWFGSSRHDEHGASPAQALLLALTAPIAAVLLQLGISRSREYLADQSGAGLSGDPEALASALEKLEAGAARLRSHADPATASLFIVNPFAGAGGVLSLFSTHPPIAERVRRLRAMALGHAHG